MKNAPITVLVIALTIGATVIVPTFNLIIKLVIIIINNIIIIIII